MAEGISVQSVYLGDGLYAQFDGFQFILYADRENGRHWVALEPFVFDALIQFAMRLGVYSPEQKS